MPSHYKLVTAKAPVNIAVIKYWGKANELLKLPINDSLSGTLGIDEMCATTSVAISDQFQDDELWLNGQKQSLTSHVQMLIGAIRNRSSIGDEYTKYKVHIASYNNFPTAAGLASSAAGYACLAFALGRTFGLQDPVELSKLARMGSGSACRSLFGGFVQWVRGTDHETSKAIQIVDHEHWPEIRVVIIVVNDRQKDVPSGEGMRRSVETSNLLKYRAESVVPNRISEMKKAILDKNFETFAQLTMQDSNQFHAICLDSEPPIFYLNETSRQIIKICSIINAHYDKKMVAYTFDAGPNACIYLLESYVPELLELIRKFFILTQGELEIKGIQYDNKTDIDEQLLCKLKNAGILQMPDAISYLISTKLGGGPVLVDTHLSDATLKPL